MVDNLFHGTGDNVGSAHDDIHADYDVIDRYVKDSADACDQWRGTMAGTLPGVNGYMPGLPLVLSSLGLPAVDTINGWLKDTCENWRQTSNDYHGQLMYLGTDMLACKMYYMNADIEAGRLTMNTEILAQIEHGNQWIRQRNTATADSNADTIVKNRERGGGDHNAEAAASNDAIMARNEETTEANDEIEVFNAGVAAEHDADVSEGGDSPVPGEESMYGEEEAHWRDVRQAQIDDGLFSG
ncbi:MAG: hypothetical protein ACRCYX_02820 [Dermatophilaceae bacterium]